MNTHVTDAARDMADRLAGDPAELLGTKRIGTLLGYHATTVRRMCESGTFPNAFRRAGGKWRVPRADVVAFWRTAVARPRRRP